MIWVRGDRNLVEELAARDDVFHVYANPWVAPARSGRPQRPARRRRPTRSSGASPRCTRRTVWALGYTGQGIVVAGARTRDTSGTTPRSSSSTAAGPGSADHNYNWHDSIHSGGGSCGADSAAPCDDFGHGTHTMGTMVGDDGGSNQIGVAPGAQWIGCRNMDVGAGTPETYSECFQWFIAPTDLANLNPDPSKAPARHQQLLGLPVGRGLHRRRRRCRPSSRTRARPASRSSSRRATPAAPAATVAEPPAIYDAVLLDRRNRQLRRHRRLLEPRARHGRRQQPVEARHLRARRQRALERAGRRLRRLQRHEHGGTPRRRASWPSCSRRTPISSAIPTRSSRS